MMAVVADDCSGRGVGGICCRRPDCCAPPRPGLWLQVHGHQAFMSSAIRQRVCHNLTPYAMSDKPGQPCHQETPPDTAMRPASVRDMPPGRRRVPGAMWRGATFPGLPTSRRTAEIHPEQRWRRDLNPRTVLAVSRFQGECIRPLCHATVGKPSGSARRPIPRRVRRRREAPLRPPRPPCGSSRRWRPAVAVSGASDSAHARTRSTSASPPRPACGPAR